MLNFKENILSIKFELIKLLICKKDFNKEQLEELRNYLILINNLEKETVNNVKNTEKMELVKTYISKVK